MSWKNGLQEGFCSELTVTTYRSYLLVFACIYSLDSLEKNWTWKEGVCGILWVLKIFNLEEAAISVDHSQISEISWVDEFLPFESGKEILQMDTHPLAFFGIFLSNLKMYFLLKVGDIPVLCQFTKRVYIWVVATQLFLISTPNFGEMIQFDEHIFQMGWFNHQPDYDWILGFFAHFE